MTSDMQTTPLAFRGRVVLPDTILDQGAVLCRSGRITAIRRGNVLPRGLPGGATVIDAGGGWIVPGFVDIHVHGADGADYMDGSASAVKTANRAHLRRGTTTIFPTTTTGSPAQVRRMLDACLDVRRSWTGEDGARIAGVHLY